MAIGDDFEIQNDKDIRYIGGATNYTVLELHRWLQDKADDASSTPDDFMDITRDTPSDKSFDTIINLINGFNIDDTAATHLYSGSIIQGAGAEIYDGIQVLAPAGMYLNIIQDGALATNFWTTALNADSANGISHRFMLKVRTAGVDIDGRRFTATTREWGKLFLEFSVNGTSRGVNVVALTSWGDDLNNTSLVGALTAAPYTNVALITAGYKGLDVNNNTVNEFYYSEWDLAGASVLNFYERLKYLTRRGETTTLYGLAGQLFRGITHELIVDTPTGTFSSFEAVSWSGGTGRMLAIDSVTAATKMWIQLLTGVIPTDNQVITGASAATVQLNVTVTSRTVTAPFVGVSTGANIIGAYGVGVQPPDIATADKLTALDNVVYNPPNFVTFSVGGLVAAEDYVTVGPFGRRFDYDAEASGPFVVGETLTFVSPAGTAVLAELRDLGTTGEMTIGPMLTGSPPADNTTMTGGTSGATAAVNGTPASALDTRQLVLNGALVGAAVTAVVVSAAIPADTPNTGTIRILRANGVYTKHAYSARSGSTFTIGSTDFSANNAADSTNVFISYIDVLAGAASVAFTGVYVSDRSLFIRVRDGGVTPIKTFESTGTLGSAGGSATAVRTSDL